jgi:hypothetical protein
MNVKKIAGTATIAGLLGAAALGLGVGSAQAIPGPPGPGIPGPGIPGPWIPDLYDWADWNPWSPGNIKNTFAPRTRPVTGSGVHTGYPAPEVL